MFRQEWLQSSRISVLELAYISVGKELHPAQSMEEPEFWRHRNLKDAIADGALTSCGERYPYPRMPDVPHGGSLLRFDDLADYAKTVSFDWLNNVLKLWEAVGAEAPQEELEEMFGSFRTAPQTTPARRRGRGGRKPGSGSYASKDKPLLELMKPLIAGGKTHWAAAMEVVGKAAGTSTDESKAKRLVKRFKEWEKTTQFN